MRPKMMSMNLAAAGILAIATAGGIGTAQAATGQEVHLRVEIRDAGTGEDRVKLNLPIAAVDAILDAAGEQIETEWVDLKQETHGVDIKKLYLSLRDQDLSELLEVNGDDGERVKVWKDREAFRVHVWDDGATEPKVKIQLPLAVTDALFGGPPDAPPDLKAAVAKLKEFAPLTLVEVNEGDESIRIWLE